jgi:ABC-type phosphate/phosphonate transport system substrate-binding protein
MFGSKIFRMGAPALLAPVLGLASLLPANEKTEGRAEFVRIGMVNSLFRDVKPALMQMSLQPFSSLVRSQTGLDGRAVVIDDALTLGQQLHDDKVQFGVFHGVEFAWIHQKYPTLKPLVIAVSGRPVLHALLVVRADSKCGEAANLQGKVVALPRMSREHCRLFLERRCCPSDQSPETFFGQVSTPFCVEAALDNVVDDEAQAAVVDESAFEAYQKNKPGRAAKLKTLLQSEAFPCAVLAYQPGAPGVPPSVLQSFRDGLISAKDNPKAQPLLKANRITGFDAVPTDYEQELADILKAYPPPAK